MTGTLAIVADGVDKTYPDGTHALQPVHLEVAEGEFVTLLGPSGCGKSTLLKLVAGLLDMDQGTLQLWGQPPAALKQSGRRLAFVFQSPTLMPWADVRGNVRLPLDLAGVAAPEAEHGLRLAIDEPDHAGPIHPHQGVRHGLNQAVELASQP